MEKDIQKIEAAFYELFYLDKEKGYEYLKSEIVDMQYEVKLKLFTLLLFDEWYAVSHEKYIERILDIFGKSAI